MAKASLLPYSWKKYVHFYWSYTSFCVFLASFLEFSYSCFISFNFSIFVSLALKIHNYNDLKLVCKQHWNFNEFNFYMIKNKHVIYRQLRSGWEKLCPRSWKRPSPFELGPF
jgi:hypothetical protein